MAQRALGIPAGVTRRSFLVQSSLPIAVGCALVVPVTMAAGVGFLAFWGAGQARDLNVWVPLLSMGAISVTAAAATGWLLGRSRLNLEALSD